MRHPVIAYTAAIAVLAAAVLLRWLLDPLMGDTLPLVTLFGAVAVTVWIGGYRPAVLVVILGYLACDYLIIEPRGEFSFYELENAVGLGAYLFTCALIIGFGEAMRIAQVRTSAQRELLRVTLGSIGDAVITTDTQGRITYLNSIAEALTGWTQQEAQNLPLSTVFRIVNEQTRQEVESPAARALREGAVVGLANHTVLIRQDGAERPIDDSAAPIKDDRGRVCGCVLVCRDVSERRRLENAAANRLADARFLAAIVESSDDAIISKSLDGIIQTWNAAAERLFRYTAQQAVGRHISLVIPPDRISEEEQIIASLRAGKRVHHFETVRHNSNGQPILVSLTISPIKDDAGNVIGASKIVRDITEHKRAEAELQKFATLVENSTDFIGICDLQAIPIYINPAGLKMVGLEGIEEARRVHVRDFFFPEDQYRIMNEFFPSVMDKGHGEIEVRFRHFKTAEARWMAYKVLALTDAGHVTAYATVSQDVTERRRLEDNLRKLAADLAEVDRRKNEFLATLAHELRNPLAPLSNMLEILKRSAGDRNIAQQALGTMERQLGQMVRLVDDLLDLNRITHNRLELRKSQVTLTSVIHQAVENSRPLAESVGHELQIKLPTETIHLQADPVRMAQVFGNLLNNSCKYTNPGGKIWVTAERQGSDAVVTIKDTGTGIPPEKLESIFDMFTQIDGSLERSQGGLGIGLTLVKRLVQMHGGSIEARSGGAGRGSEFIVRLPVVESPKVETLGPSPAQEATRTQRILVVDDNRDSATSLALLLRITGNETYTAHDGTAAYEAAEKFRPEVVLLDIGLPESNGYDVCRRIRQQPWGKNMTLIALTGWGQEEDRRKSREAGFDDHLLKPVDYAALVRLLSSLTAAHTTTGS